MKIALLGYGKMGKEIESILLQRGHEVSLRASSEHPFTASDLHGTDVAIEFSKPELAVENMFKCFEAKCPVVVGTTGWYGRLEEVKTVCSEKKSTLLYSTNFSIGVNVVFHINRQLARIMNQLDQYEPSIKEIHHLAKLDAPSGTGITLAEGILDEIKRKDHWVNRASEKADELALESERLGEVPGTHEIVYDSEVDTITLIHQAKNRKGFALGSVLAAEWLVNNPGIHTMNDFLKF
ncbi:MAG: 4-hydroxy-tetrahydrodipicolinate reductase [Flavobacteriales bacterium]|jgi:4-hydroxy-tetrahydrodipicolinate reductase